MKKKEGKLRTLQEELIFLLAVLAIVIWFFCALIIIDNGKVVQTEVVVSHYVDRDGNPAEAGENNGHIDEPPIVD